jgi:hypothetical protein
MTFPGVSDNDVNTSGDWEAFSTSFGQFHALDAAAANSSLNHVTLSPIAKRRQNQKQHSIITCMTPPKIVRKDADRIILLDHSDPAATLETPTKTLLGASAFAYDTPPHKKLFDDSDNEKDNDTPKTCNTSNLSSSFVVNQISFDPNKTSSFVEDPEESFDTLFSSTTTTSSSANNRRRSYFDDSLEQESTTTSTTPSTSILHQAEQVFLQQVDTLMEKFMWACVQQEKESNTAHGANPTNKKNEKTTSGDNNHNSNKTKRVVQV